MKILGIVGSPRSKGNTFSIINWMLEAAKEEKVDFEVLALSELDIKYCTGCTKCFIEGSCPINDDMKLVHRKMLDSDGIIFGAPSKV